MLNPFFQQGSKSEQNLIQDLINEQLRMYGVEIYYIPRKYITKKTIISEVIQSEFDNAYPIEAYVENYEGYGGVGTLLSKFGIQELDDLTLIISKERYENYITPLIQNLPNIELATRPKEGDLVYFPLGDKLFEIKYVEHEKPFYQLQKNYVYELRCELYAYNDEEIDTGILEIDDNVKDEGYIQTFNMVGLGSTATAITSLRDGSVRRITVSRRGSGYTSVPRVAITSAPSGGLTAVGIASMIKGIVDFCDTSPDTSRVQAVNITNPGFGYTIAPRVTFIGGGGNGAYATASISSRAVGIITITSGGSGYIGIPTVSFVKSGIGSTTINAVGRAVVSTAGTVTAIILEDAGGYYEAAPTIVIAGPQQTVGYGTYLYNENVIGAASSSRAKVKSWDGVNKILKLGNILGDFIEGEAIIGQASGAAYAITVLNKNNIPEDKFAQNQAIEIEADNIIDFSETNPFGIP